MLREQIIKRNSTNPLREKTFQMAQRIIKLNQYLTTEKKEFILSKQVLRSGTNPGAMVREAINAESGNDFIHKLSIALKETGETQYWLELLYMSNYLSDTEFESIHTDTIEVTKILTASIRTKKKNLAIKVSSILIILSILIFTFSS
jgi:four helix bundle protein